jgi:hypothetical protein
MQEYTVDLLRKCGERTNDAVIRKQVNWLCEHSIKGPQYQITELHEPYKPENVWIFQYRITFTATPAAYERITKAFDERCSNIKFGRWPWERVTGNTTLVSPDAVIEQPPAYTRIEIKRDNGHFDHIYDRTAQIERVLASVDVAIRTKMEHRYHCVLYGPPGCGKTEILLAVCKMLGDEYDAYIKFDATSTSKAGVEKLLLNPDIPVPPVMLIEEIEKTDENSLRWLLGILDQRGEMRKINARCNLSRKAPMLCLATANNMSLFNGMLAGALSSRFAHKLYCGRPSREIISRILQREVTAAGGNPEWIDIALRFAVDEMKLTDPREIIPICICGGDKLLTGEYQQWYIATQPLDESKYQ